MELSEECLLSTGKVLGLITSTAKIKLVQLVVSQSKLQCPER